MPKFRVAASRLAFAAALATTAAAGMTVAASPAHAQKKEKPAPAAKANYSKPFVAVYQPIAKVVTANGDLAPLKAQIRQIIFTMGSKTSDIAVQRQGLDMMLDSGKTAPADLGRNSFASAQLAYNAKEMPKARLRAEQAIAAGYSGDAELIIAETWFAENNTAAGLAAIEKAVARRTAANQPVPEAWIKRALAQAYQGKLPAETSKYAILYAQNYPSPTSWCDAIAIQRNTVNYEGQELLDLLRLAARTNALRYERDYADYIEAADARRLPGETQRIIDAGIAAGLLKANNVFVNEARTISSSRVKADMADLPNLERDAKAAGGTAATAAAAGDAFLSYNQPAKAEEFYKLALTRSGVDAARVNTRLGIAQADQGKTAEAQATFAKVTGARQPIAQLWSVYAGQKGATVAAAQ